MVKGNKIYIQLGVIQKHGKIIRIGKRLIRIKLDNGELESFKLNDNSIKFYNTPKMTINRHEIVHADDAGNGYHGRCKYCNLPFVTDLGYCSWEGTTCVDRIITDECDLPSKIRSYAKYHSYVWDYKRQIYVKATFSKELNELSPLQIQEITN